MLKKSKEQSGITLVALVVTIVVLLILAGITIALVFSSNGVVSKAQEAYKDSNKGTIADNIQGFIVSQQMQVLQDAKAIDDVRGDLETALAKAGITVDSSNKGTIKINADTSVTISEGASLVYSLGNQKYQLLSYTDGVPTFKDLGSVNASTDK